MEEPGTLIKFGDLEHMTVLQEQGLMYMNPVSYFWGLEDQGVRGDRYDGVHELMRGNHIAIEVPGNPPRKMHFEGEWCMGSHSQETERTKVFCMYALRPSVVGFPIDRRNVLFGTMALVMTDPDQFLARIVHAVKSQKIQGRAGLVEYVNELHTGHVGPFRKLRQFAYQSEWRFVCRNDSEGPMEMRIGDLRDISVLMKSEDVNSSIAISS